MSNENAWLTTHGRRVNVVMSNIDRQIFKGTDGELNLQEINTLFRGALLEINKLDDEIIDLKNQLKEATKDKITEG